MEGFPSAGTWDHFSRMLYLSASTITTLGFGDIVPITATARLLIAMESLMGIVLVGLFLNALSYERAQPNN
jgi:voltage-gated potassium channel Kch